MRFVFWLIGTALLVAYGRLAHQVYASTVRPEGSTSASWVVGPPAAALEQAAERHIERGLDRLGTSSRDVPEAFRAFREELRVAEGLLTRCLRAEPTRARAVARLAAVRWELAPPTNDAERRLHLETIRLASDLAPVSPGVQIQLGELLLRMGQREDARDYFARAIELDPSLGHEITRLAAEHVGTAPEILAALPEHPRIVAALEPFFFRESRDLEYLAVLEQALDDPRGLRQPELFASYGKTCERAGRLAQLLARLEGLGPLPDPATEAERLKQVSRAHMGLGRTALALAAAASARRQMPDSPVLAEHEGDMLLAAGNPGAAIEVFRETLGRVARDHDDARWRARLYRKIGQAEESRGAADLAQRPYRMALRLDPAEPHAARRLLEMEKAAGLTASD